MRSLPICDHNSLSFNIVMEKDRTSPQVKVLNWSRANFGDIRQDLAEVNWVNLFEGKGTTGKWEAFKSVISRVQGQYVPVRVKGKAGRFRDPWLTRDIEVLVRKKKKAYIRFKRSGSSDFLDDYKKCRSTLKREIRRAKRGYEMDLAYKVTMSMDDGGAVDIVDMDFTKAFNKVLHGRLVMEVGLHGI
eukprot:g39532.t1